MSWTEYEDGVEFVEVKHLAKGSYQRGVLRGAESLSGSTLTGTARKWGAGYHMSREQLLWRLKQAGYRIEERRGDRGARILVIGRGKKV